MYRNETNITTHRDPPLPPPDFNAPVPEFHNFFLIPSKEIFLVRVKVKLSLCLTKHHAMKTYWVSRGIAARILDLSTRWRWVVSFTPRPLYPQGKSPWYPLVMQLSGPQSRSGHRGEEKNSQPLSGLKPLIIQPVTQHYTTELSWLLRKLILC
jgi:hypothetical protein